MFVCLNNPILRLLPDFSHFNIQQSDRLLSLSHRHTKYSLAQSYTSNTPILLIKSYMYGRLPFNHRHRQLSFSDKQTDYFYSHSDTKTTPSLTQTHRLLPYSFTDTQTTPILTQTHTLLPFSLRHTD